MHTIDHGMQENTGSVERLLRDSPDSDRKISSGAAGAGEISASLPAPSAEFDYSELKEATAVKLRETARRIHARYDRTIALIIATGHELLEVKSELEHGQFMRWLEAEFGWSDRTARNYMNAAKHFSDKVETVSALPPAALYRLSAPSTPKAVRAQVLDELTEKKPVSEARVKKLVEQAKQAKAPARPKASCAAEKPNRGEQSDAMAGEADRVPPQNVEPQEEEATRKAVGLITKRLGDELDEFVTLYNAASPSLFRQLLAAALGGEEPAVP